MTTPPFDDLLLRTALPDDAADLGRLAALDSAAQLGGPALVAEADGAIVAALCPSTGRGVANPFVPCSLHLLAMLRRHTADRRGGVPRHRRLRTPPGLRRADQLIGAGRP
jgi:hypothetical protein